MIAAPAARDGADRVRHGDLARLVEDDEVEELLVGRQELRDRQRAHHQAGGEPGEHVAHLTDELADRHVGPLALELAGEDRVAGRRVRVVASATTPESLARM